MAETTDNIYDRYDRLNDDDSDPLDLIGKVIAGKYRIDSFIGEGGFGKVYTGINVNLVHQKVVIKFFTRAKLKDRFDQEAEIICKLAHPGICSLIDYLAEDRALVIPYIDGIDLHRQLKTEGPLSAAQLMRFGREILEAIQFAHSKSIAHRDIKPSNIMIGKNNRAYLIDFGIAKEIKKDSTQTTTFMGTPDFAAPERHRKSPDYNPFLTDIFELGVTLFYLATKTHLYQDRDHPDPNDWNLPNTDKLSPRLKRVLRKATQPEPSQRYQSVSDMLADFRRVKHPYRRVSTAARVLMIAASVVIVLAAGDAVNQRYDIAGLPGIIPWPAGFARQAAPVDTLPTTPAVMPSQDIVPDTHLAVAEDTAETVPATVINPIVADIEPEPAIPQMRIAVRPPGLIHLEVDGQDREPDRLFETTPGQHEIVIEHSEYPIYNTVASVFTGMADLTFNLEERFPRHDSTSIILVVLPRDEHLGFDLSCNRKVYAFDKSREFSFFLKNGSWNISAEVRSLVPGVREHLTVDSIVVGVVGKSQTEVIPGSRGRLEVNSGPAGDQKMRLLIHWSEDHRNVRR